MGFSVGLSDNRKADVQTHKIEQLPQNQSRNVSQTTNPNDLAAAGKKTVAAAPASEHKAPLGLRTVALFELGKGLLILLIGLYLLSLVHKNVEAEATNLMHVLHADPAWHISQWFLNYVGTLTDQRLRLFALIAACYFIVRVRRSFWFVARTALGGMVRHDFGGTLPAVRGVSFVRPHDAAKSGVLHRESRHRFLSLPRADHQSPQKGGAEKSSAATAAGEVLN